jgi:hypothetical protein
MAHPPTPERKNREEEAAKSDLATGEGLSPSDRFKALTRRLVRVSRDELVEQEKRLVNTRHPRPQEQEEG